MRTGQLVTSQWICELFPGVYVKILDVDTDAKIGRQRALVKTQLSFIRGWISIRTSRSSYLVEACSEDECCLFDLPGSNQICGCELRSDPSGLAGVIRNLTSHIKRQPDFGTLTSADFIVSQRLQSLFRVASGGDNANLDAQRLRWSLWATLSPNRSSPEGLAILAVVMLQLRDAILEMDSLLMRLHEEFVCLEDTDAEALFNASGETHAAAMKAKQLSQRCRHVANTITLPSSAWFAHLPNPASIVVDLARGEEALLELHDEKAVLANQRRILIARVKAAVEARAATEAVSAASLLAEALRPDKRLDFPLVTEFCDRATSDKAELADVVDALTQVLKENQGLPLLPQRLKALTLTNELMYDDAARQAFARHPGFLSVLMSMGSTDSTDSTASVTSPIPPGVAFDLAAANAQLLTTEIARRVSTEAASLKAGCFAVAPAAQGSVAAPSWLVSVARTPGRQTGQTQHVLSWPHTCSALNALRASLQSGAASTQDITSVLDHIYRSLDEATGQVSQLRKSLDHTISADVGELIDNFLLSATRVNSRVLEWKCTAVNALDEAEASVANSSPSPLSNRGQRKHLAKLLDRAESAGESLNTCLTVLLARRPTDGELPWLMPDGPAPA